MIPYSPSAELRRLADGMLEGRLSRADAARLEELLESDPAAMDYWLDTARREDELRRVLDGMSADTAASTPATADQRRWFRLWIPMAIAAAAAVVLLVARHLPGPHSPPETAGPPDRSTAPAGPPARLTNALDVDWISTPALPGQDLGRQTLVFASGLAEITHATGTRLLIEGPARYEITGENSGKLAHGRLVASVPPGAEGYTVEYADGRIVDIGTEFALDIPEHAGPPEVGVFRGEVRVLPGHTQPEQAAPLTTGHAARVTNSPGTGLRSIPFVQDRFIRQFPSREMPWFHRGGSEPMEWNVSPLVWNDGDYIAVVKWMSGPRALILRRVELLLDGKVVAADEHSSSIGDLSSTVGNIYQFHLPDGTWKRGQWTLRAWPEPAAEEGTSEGIILLESGDSRHATTTDFAGSWEYTHDGETYHREFHPDGSCTLQINGRPSTYFQDARWEVADGVLRVSFPASKLVEEHLLRDRDSLIFVNQPYRNASRAHREERKDN